MSNLVLASKSPRRRELFTFITSSFICCETDIDETKYDNLNAEQQVLFLARDKCLYAYKDYPKSVVIGCDTLVDLNGRVMGKPMDRNDAFQMIKALSGNTHKVFTGVAIKTEADFINFAVETEVTFFDMTDEEIAEYVSSGEADDKAGAYGMQSKASKYIRGIKGDYFNVIGLPVSLIYRYLHEKNIV